jgi:hypothetical protein
LLALRKLGFKAISSAARKDDIVEDLRYVPYTTSLRELRSAVAEAVHSGQQSFIMAVFHGCEFTESGCKGAWLSLGDFDDLVREVSASRDVQFVTIAAAAASGNGEFNGEQSQLYAVYRDRVGRLGDILRLLGPLGAKLQAALPMGTVLYPEPHMRRVAFRMLCVEIAVNALLGVAVAGLFIVGLRVLSLFPSARYIRALFLAGGFVCLVLLVTEGIVGVVGGPGFSSRLIILITCTGAGLVAGLAPASTRSRK